MGAKAPFFTMKKILFTLAMLGGIAYGQSIGYLRYDSVRIEKIGGNGELILLNGTRNVTGGILTNIGNGRTGFVAPVGQRFGIEDTVLTTARHVTIGNDSYNGGRNNSLVFSNVGSDSSVSGGRYPQVGTIGSPYAGYMILKNKIHKQAWGSMDPLQYGGIEYNYASKEFDSVQTTYDSLANPIVLPIMISHNVGRFYPPRDRVNVFSGQDGNNGALIEGNYDIGDTFGYNYKVVGNTGTPDFPIPIFNADFDFQRRSSLTRQRIITGASHTGFLWSFKAYQNTIASSTVETGNYINKLSGSRYYGMAQSFGHVSSTKAHILAVSNIDTVVAIEIDSLYRRFNEVGNGYGVWQKGTNDFNVWRGKSIFGSGTFPTNLNGGLPYDINTTSAGIKDLWMQGNYIGADNTETPFALKFHTKDSLSKYVFYSLDNKSATFSIKGRSVPLGESNLGGIDATIDYTNVSGDTKPTSFRIYRKARNVASVLVAEADTLGWRLPRNIYVPTTDSSDRSISSGWLKRFMSTYSGGGGGGGITTFTDGNGFDGTVSGTDLSLTTSLTTGSVPFIAASGALSQNNANFFWDATNARLGLGTAAPGSRLHVAGSLPGISVVQMVNTSATGYGPFISVNHSNPAYYAMRVANSTNIYSFFVRGDGNVGIGSGTPLQRLHVQGSARVTDSLYANKLPVSTDQGDSALVINATDRTVRTRATIINDAGAYTPTLTNVASTSGYSGLVFTYTRMGNIVTVYGEFGCTSTSGIANAVDITLPIASTTPVPSGSGTAVGLTFNPAHVTNGAGTTARVFWIGVGTTDLVRFSFRYTVN